MAENDERKAPDAAKEAPGFGVGKVETAPINGAMETLEDKIRRLHERLTPVLREIEPETDKPDPKPKSPLLASLDIMDELVTDALNRLEL